MIKTATQPQTAVRINPQNLLTGALLVIVPIGFTVAFTLLGTSFEYPDILRKPTGYVLERFAAGGSGLVALWYGMLLSALAFIPLSLLVRRQFVPGNLVQDMALVFGVLAGLVQALGFARWVFLVPSLATAYLDPTSSEATKAATTAVFEAFHRYAGMGLGEHLGYLFTGLWTILVAVGLMERSRALGITGILFAVGILIGLLEPAGMAWAGTVNALSYLAWSVWMVVFGVVLLIKSRNSS